MSWKLDGKIAALSLPGVSARVRLAEPYHGVSDVVVDDQRIADQLLAVRAGDAAATTEWPLADAYVREGDLVATYGETSARPFTVQAYWRIVDDPSARLALEIVFSVQTALLDAHPKFALGSMICNASGDGEPRNIAANQQRPIVIVPAGPNWSIAEIASPTDFAPGRVAASSSGAETRWQLEQEFMEKGVIRRVRVRSLLLPAAIADALAEAAFAELRAAQPPLTA